MSDQYKEEKMCYVLFYVIWGEKVFEILGVEYGMR